VNRGYVKLWRKTLDTQGAQNPKFLAFWAWCLLKASHKRCTVMVGNQLVHLEPGQFIFGRKKASRETGLSEREIRTAVAFWVSVGNLTIKATNKFSVITIINWPIYQGSEGDERPTERPTKDQQRTTNKNVEEEYIYDHFASFWKAYPRRVGKKAALKAWERLHNGKGKTPSLEMILHAIDRQRRGWSDPKYIPHPATWLNGRRWEDETEEPRKDEW